MPSKLRRLGVYGDNLPTKKSSAVVASDFGIAGLIVRAERQYAVAFETRNMNEYQEIFGGNVDPAYYGFDNATLFFQNLKGVNASLWVKAHVGNTGSAIDAVQASRNQPNRASSPHDTLSFKAGYKTYAEYGTHGNRVGHTITNGYRFTTTLDGAASTGNSYVTLKSVSGVKVGDMIDFVHSTTHVYKKITAIDETLKRVSFTGTFGSSAYVDGDSAGVMGFRVRTYEQQMSGLIKEVDSDIGQIYCTMEPEVVDFYVVNVFKNAKFTVIADLLSTETENVDTWPPDVSTVTYMSGGTLGTSPTTATHWAYGNQTAFDGKPIRMFGNCETTLVDVHKNLEVYSKARWDNPKVIPVMASNQTKAQLITIGNGYQRSDDVMMIGVAHWVKITDPFATSTIAQPREVPNVGAVMGAWIRSIATLGIHFVPSVRQIPIYGIIGIVGDQFTDDLDRTDLAEAGVNCIQYITGVGYIIRNFFTMSTTKEFTFANGILMREYFKVSCVDSLGDSENTPGSMNRIKEDRMAILMFMRRMWSSGSTGTVAEGETFGISENDDGTPTKFEDHVDVQADIVNNPQDRIDAGERNYFIYFTYPAPSGSIRIAAGFMLR